MSKTFEHFGGAVFKRLLRGSTVDMLQLPLIKNPEFETKLGH